MEIKTVDDIFAANRKIREGLRKALEGVTREQAEKPIEGEPWSIAQIVEHIAAVEESASKVCAKLLSKAQADGAVFSGSVDISDHFKAKAREIATRRVDAPDIVQPRSGRSLSDSFEKFDENAARLEGLKALFQRYDGTLLKFPHPFFGEISAQEWLFLSGQHEKRHTEQIKRLLDK